MLDLNDLNSPVDGSSDNNKRNSMGVSEHRSILQAQNQDKKEGKLVTEIRGEIHVEESLENSPIKNRLVEDSQTKSSIAGTDSSQK